MFEELKITKSEIEATIKGKDDFVKIDYLNRFLKKADNLEIKKYILLNLAGISESKGLIKEAIRQIALAVDVCLKYREKIELSMKEAELGIKIRDFDVADKAFKKALFYANSQEKMELKRQYLELYKMVGKIELDKGKIRHSIEIYKRLLSMIQDKGKQEEIIRNLIELYNRSGDISESNRLKEKLR
jgi:tetratricopeptide (TPR) repeat protein